MPPVGDDPVPRSARPAAAPIISSSAAFATSARAPSSPRWRRRPAAAAPPSRPERVAPLTDAAIAAAPNRISLKKWNRRRRPCGGPSGSGCRPRSGRRRPRAREAMDKEAEREALVSVRLRRAVGEDPILRCARPAPPTTPSNPAPRRPHQPPTRIQEMATAASSQISKKFFTGVPRPAAHETW